MIGAITPALFIFVLATSMVGASASAHVFDVKGVDVDPGKTTVETIIRSSAASPHRPTEPDLHTS